MAPTPRTALRLDLDLRRRIDQRAKAEGLSRTDWIVGACELALSSDKRVGPIDVRRPRRVKVSECGDPPT
jgi:hypothetical protein